MCTGEKRTVTNRETYFDFLRGVAIIAVVLIHTFPQQPCESYVVLRQLIGFAVPLFLAISGYFVSNKEFSDKKEFFTFFRKQSLKIYIPVIIWSIPYLCEMLLKGRVVEAIILYFVCGMSIYYFVALIIQCYLLLPMIKRKMNGYMLTFFLLLTLATNALFTYLMQIKGVAVPAIVYVGIFPALIGFFAIGVYLRKNGRDYNPYLWLVLAVITCFFSYMETKWLQSFNGGGVGTKPSNLILCFFVVLFLFSSRFQRRINLDNIVSKALLFVGKYSFGIYLIHCFFVSLVKMDLWFVRAIIVIIASLLFILISRKILPEKLNRLLGFY